jgi:membrane protein DedA with SNARE-associated domain
MDDLFLNWMTAYGVPVLIVALLAQPLGLPIPAGLLVLAAGASARQGLISWPGVAAVTLAAAVLGDCASYALGRAGGRWLWRRVGCRGQAVWLRAEDQFTHRGELAVFLTRVVLTSLEMATNLVAGSSRYPFRRFAAWAAAGRATWIGVYGGLGYVLGTQWQLARQAIDRCGPWLSVLVLGGIVLGLFARYLSKRRRDGRSEPRAVPVEHHATLSPS